MSATLATHCRSLQAEKALLCGLFVNIGTIAILQFLQKKNDLPTSSTALWELVNPIADKAGTLILEHWGFEEDYCNVTRFRHHWDAENSTHISYVDVVLVAEALIHIPNHVDHIEDWFTHLPSRRKLALDGFPLTHPKLTEELQQEYQQNLQLLSI